MESPDGIAPCPPVDPCERATLADWPGFDVGPLPYPLAGNDHVASLVPIEPERVSLIDVGIVDGDVDLFFSRSSRLRLTKPIFPIVHTKPPGAVTFSSDLDVYLDGCAFPALHETVVPWLKTGSSHRFQYASDDPHAYTVFDGHFLTPIAAKYVDYLPGLSAERGFIPALGIVVWTGTYEGTRFICFQSTRAVETDPHWVCGCRVSEASPGYWTSFQVQWNDHIPTAWVTMHVPSPAMVISDRRVWPIFRQNGVTMALVPTKPFVVLDANGATNHPGSNIFYEEFVKEWTEERIVTPLLSGHYVVHGAGTAEIISCVLPHGKVAPSMVLQGLMYQGSAPGYVATITYRVNFSKDKQGRYGVVLPDNCRRFAISARQVIKHDARYQLRKLKIFKAPFECVPYVKYAWSVAGTVSRIPVNFLPAPDEMMQTDEHEEGAFRAWYQVAARVFEIVSWEYSCGNYGLGDVLLRARKTGTFYCLEIKKNGKGNHVWIQAWKYALFFARTLRLMGRVDKVVPAGLVGGKFAVRRAVTEQDLIEYNKGRQIWLELAESDDELPEQSSARMARHLEDYRKRQGQRHGTN